MTLVKKHRKIAIVLTQLGSPESSRPSSIRRFLKEFLLDPRVIDIPLVLRFLLLYLIILPTRVKKSAKKYQSIWTREGSPLVVHSNNLAREVQKKIDKLYPDKFIIRMSYRYGKQKIGEIIDLLIKENVKNIQLLPLFPQYSSATTGSIYEKGLKKIASRVNIPPIQLLPPFYDNEKYIEAQAYIIEDYLKKKENKKKVFIFYLHFMVYLYSRLKKLTHPLAIV